MISRNGKKRIIIEIDAIKQSISVEIDAQYLRKIECPDRMAVALY